MPYYFPIGFMNFTRFLKEPVNFRDFVTNTTKRKNQVGIKKEEKGEEKEVSGERLQ